jgi:nitrogen fixation NifU-like protein
MTASYSETLLEHARHPCNLGVDNEATNIGKADLDGRPPSVEFYLRILEDRIESAKFQAAGCGVTIACGSALTELVIGVCIENARELDREDLIAALNGVPIHKLYCVDISLAAFSNALPCAV